jgi:hypothetical protein
MSCEIADGMISMGIVTMPRFVVTRASDGSKNVRECHERNVIDIRCGTGRLTVQSCREFWQ